MSSDVPEVSALAINVTIPDGLQAASRASALWAAHGGLG